MHLCRLTLRDATTKIPKYSAATTVELKEIYG